MRLIQKATFLSLILVSSFASAQLQPRIDTSTMVNQPAARIAGDYSGDVVASLDSGLSPTRNINWEGQMTGTIEASGQIDFTNSMGCRLKGFMVNMLMTIKGTAKATGCSKPEFNRTYQVSALPQKEGLRLNFAVVDFDRKSALRDIWIIDGVFAKNSASTQ